MPAQYSVIIPTFNSEKHIGKAIGAIRMASTACEIIVCDGGSRDKTRDIAASMGVVVMSSRRGRGTQLMEGFRHSQGQILIFLHSDTLISPKLFDILEEHFIKNEMRIGKLRLTFNYPSRVLSFYSYLAKFDSFWTSFVDQGIVVRRDFYEAIGGFPDWPLLEDVCFFQKARKQSKVHTLPVEVVTSAERFIKKGFFKQQIFNGKILIKYLMGFSIQTLSQECERR